MTEERFDSLRAELVRRIRTRLALIKEHRFDAYSFAWGYEPVYGKNSSAFNLEVATVVDNNTRHIHSYYDVSNAEDFQVLEDRVVHEMTKLYGEPK